MALSTAMDAALAGPVVMAFDALRIALPSGQTVRLMTGAGQVSFGGETYLGRDATYGTIASLESASEDIATSAPRYQAVLMPPALSGLLALTAPEAQGSSVSVYFGLVNEATGLVIGSPELVFLGEIDTVKLVAGANSRMVEIDVNSVWERCFADTEGARLNNHFHQTMWPGELGFTFVVDAADDPYWGADGPKPATTSAGGGLASGNLSASALRQWAFR
jgi:hypothetical protein